MALVRDGAKVAVYLNGKPAPEISGEAAPAPAAQPGSIFIGGRSDRTATLEGKIAEAALYARALPAEELTKHYRAAAVAQSGVAAPFVYVCQDAGAGGYEAFPDVCRLSDGRLIAVFYAGYGHVSMPCPRLPKGGRICYCTSADEGHTWTKAEVLYDGPDDDRDPSIVQLKNGQVICNFFSLKLGPNGKGWIGLGSWMVTSDDLGKTWSAPR